MPTGASAPPPRASLALFSFRMIAPASKRKELRTFRSLRTLRVLNVLAVGSSLAGGVGAGLAVLADVVGTDSLALASACSTLVFGVAWAAVLRIRQRIPGTGVRWSWLASFPIAVANAATACGALFFDIDDPIQSFLKGAFVGATWGAGIWLPALMTTLLAFGAPIAWAQKRAERGLAGEERGEVVIGLVSAVIAAIALLMVGIAIAPIHHAKQGVPIITALSLVGLVAGILATAFSLRREGVRRKFVRNVEAGAVQGYRVDPTPEGKVLIRVTSMGQGYRVADFEEDLVTLDEEGEARRLTRHI